LVSPPAGALRCTVKVRYRQADQVATLHPQADGSALIEFDHAQRAVTPGQYAVIYDNDRCLGGAVIEQTTPATTLQAADFMQAAARA
jgi:tRNA-specific 2-thiouridylase